MFSTANTFFPLHFLYILFNIFYSPFPPCYLLSSDITITNILHSLHPVIVLSISTTHIFHPSISNEHSASCTPRHCTFFFFSLSTTNISFTLISIFFFSVLSLLSLQQGYFTLLSRLPTLFYSFLCSKLMYFLFSQVTFFF